MKSVMIAAAALVAMTGVAAAEVPTFVGYSEYAVEAETFELGAGAEFILADRLILTPTLVGFGTADEFDFDRLEVKASYGLNENLDMYGKLKTDADFKYDEAIVGVAFQF